MYETISNLPSSPPRVSTDDVDPEECRTSEKDKRTKKIRHKKKTKKKTVDVMHRFCEPKTKKKQGKGEGKGRVKVKKGEEVEGEAKGKGEGKGKGKGEG